MVLGPLESAWVVPVALAACGLLFLGDAAVEGGPRRHTLETFALNFLSLPVGGFTLFIGALDWYADGSLTLFSGSAVAVGAVLAGRSLREIPWTGFASLAAAAVAGWYLVQHSAGSLPLPGILAVSALVFLIVFGLLYLIELPLRLAGLLALPRPLLLAFGVATLGLAGYFALLGIN